MKSTIKRALLLGALCGLSVSSAYSMKMVTKKVNEVSTAFATGPDFTEIKVSDDLNERLEQCAVELKKKVDSKEVLQHMLISGPRECQAAFAARLAQLSEIDYFYLDFDAEIIEDKLRQFSVEDLIGQIKKLFSLAENRSRPMMVIVDQAHLIGLDTSKLDKAADDKSRLYAAFSDMFLEYLKKASKKSMIVAITTHRNHMSDNVMACFGEEIVFEVPDTAVKLKKLFWNNPTPAFTPDGRYAVSRSIDNTRLWDLTKDPITSEELRHTDWVSSVTFSPDSRYVILSSDKTLRLWDLTKDPITWKDFKGHTGSVESVSIGSDGQVVSIEK